MSTTDTSVLIVADAHCGSVSGVMPETVIEKTNEDEVERRISPRQRILLGIWDDMVDNYPKVDVMVCNGDMVDGVQYKSRGRGLVTSNIATQVEMAQELVGRVNAKERVFTEGSAYHGGENMAADAVLAGKFEGAKTGMDYALKIADQGVRLHFSHEVGVSTSSWQYRTTPIARELVSALLNEKEYGKFNGVIRSHAHYYCFVEFGSHFGMITPCYQLRTPYTVRKGLSLLPKLGYVVLHVNHGEVTRERHLWSVKSPVKELVV